MHGTSIQMVREDLTKDFRALADTHTKAIGSLLEEFKDNQLLQTLDIERALNENTPDSPEVGEATQREQEHETPTFPTTQSDTKDEPKMSAEQHLPAALKPDIPPAPKEETTNPEGILEILTQDWE